MGTLEDPELPWGAGVAVYLDAGNRFIGPLAPVIDALRHSDVVAHANLWFPERKMARPDALSLVRGGSLAWVQDAPQVGTPLIAARKTPTSLRFLREWRAVMREGVLLAHQNETTTYLERLRGDRVFKFTSETEPIEGAALSAAPFSYQHHPDQMAFSVLFKQYGFRPISSELLHSTVALLRDRT